MAQRPYTELVAILWLRGVTGLSKVMVDSELPDEVTGWVSTGFVTVKTVSGSRDMYLPIRHPVVTVDCWATSTVSTDPPWDLSHKLAEYVDAGCRARVVHRTVSTLGFTTARVHSAYLVTEPRRLYFGEGNYARVMFDMALHWTDLS